VLFLAEAFALFLQHFEDGHVKEMRRPLEHTDVEINSIGLVTTHIHVHPKICIRSNSSQSFLLRTVDRRHAVDRSCEQRPRRGGAVLVGFLGERNCAAQKGNTLT
jgi:hypothetical protein